MSEQLPLELGGQQHEGTSLLEGGREGLMMRTCAADERGGAETSASRWYELACHGEKESHSYKSGTELSLSQSPPEHLCWRREDGTSNDGGKSLSALDNHVSPSHTPAAQNTVQPSAPHLIRHHYKQ